MSRVLLRLGEAALAALETFGIVLVFLLIAGASSSGSPVRLLDETLRLWLLCCALPIGVWLLLMLLHLAIRRSQADRRLRTVDMILGVLPPLLLFVLLFVLWGLEPHGWGLLVLAAGLIPLLATSAVNALVPLLTRR